MRIKDIDSLPDGQLKKQIKRQVKKSDHKSSGRNDHEHHLQKQAKKYMIYAYPDLEKRFFAIPNGGARDPITGSKLKAEGVLAGVWDLFLAVPKGNYGGCWIETKWGKNTLTDSQKAFRKALKDDYRFFVYRSIDEFITEIEKYMDL